MGLFRRNGKKRRPAPSGGVAGARPWVDHGLVDGETVECGRCARTLRVAPQSASSVTVSHDGALEGVALICTACGQLLCSACALAASDNPYLPRCDRCGGQVTLPVTG
ncbi:hypothetical protein [Streptomyces buecherae]|uniref:hypothetical protein n=1 Tax=Streptomyces buecherae TaxID=2763006 RepID=UPI001C260A9A|nr:hypothetical protein [Streptomyces buecherae]